MEIRNIAIIAHVDHGKTALTDAILKQTGAVVAGTSMDSNSLEKERGITIYSKNASVSYKGTKINLVDTPGHADFGSEVERVLRSIDSVLLVVDAQEGPMPQTRFVLKKSLELGLKPILVINKIDKPAANPTKTHDEVFDLFAELGANDAQLDFPYIYAIGREGIAKTKLTDESKDLTPLLDLILEKVPQASGDKNGPFIAQPFNLAYDNFLGRLAIVRVHGGSIKQGDPIYLINNDGKKEKNKVTKLFTFEGISRKDSEEIEAGDIAVVAGVPNVYIGDTLTSDENVTPLPRITIDEPTIELNFLVNNSPFAGKEGKYVTSRQLRERLEKELEINVGLKINFDTGNTDSFLVKCRGELHAAILMENMRREGFELQVSQPRVITKEVDGKLHEPFEEITIDVPESDQGVVIESLGKRKAEMKDIKLHSGRALMTFYGPSRGLFGYRGKFVIDTKGEGILATRILGYEPYAGEIEKRDTGAMISGDTGKTLTYSLGTLQTRGMLYVGAGVDVYEGMVVGNTSKGEQMVVNPVKAKQLTNFRNTSSDAAEKLTPPLLMTIETGLEIMADDEYLEVTPSNVRLRKKYLKDSERARTKRTTQKAGDKPLE